MISNGIEFGSNEVLTLNEQNPINYYWMNIWSVPEKKDIIQNSSWLMTTNDKFSDKGEKMRLLSTLIDSINIDSRMMNSIQSIMSLNLVF